ncbi:hypothetical protein ACP70R_048174 [Stipagrostis hirtigluma subsp. patula]
MMSLCSTTGSPSVGRLDVQAPDADFLLQPWCCALQLLGKDRAWEQPGIKVIRSEETLNRAPLVVGVVTSCAPNGLGDLFLTLKDPSGTIGASVHKKVLSEDNIGQDISIGCVIVLSNVTIFRPSRTACYLNVTKGKVIKVLRKDCNLPPKQEISSSTTQSQLPAESERVKDSWLGDNHMEWSAGTEISEETASIFSKMISRPKDNQIAGVLSGNVVRSSIIRGDKGSHSVGTHHGIRLVKTNPNPPSKNTPRYNTSHSINPDNGQQRHGGGSPMYERGEGSTNNVMLKLLGGQRMMPNSKEMTIAEVSRGHHGTPDTSSSSSRMSCASNSNTNGDHHKQWNILNTTCSQPNLAGSSVMSGDRYCITQASTKQELSSANELVLPSGKKLKSDAAVPDGNAKQASIRRPNEHQHKDIYAENAAPIGGSLLSNTKNVMSVASVAGWTDEQLSELFDDY